MVSKKERLQELVNLSGLLFIGYIVLLVNFILNPINEYSSFGWFMLIFGCMFGVLIIKVL